MVMEGSQSTDPSSRYSPETADVRGRRDTPTIRSPSVSTSNPQTAMHNRQKVRCSSMPVKSVGGQDPLDAPPHACLPLDSC